MNVIFNVLWFLPYRWTEIQNHIFIKMSNPAWLVIANQNKTGDHLNFHY